MKSDIDLVGIQSDDYDIIEASIGGDYSTGRGVKAIRIDQAGTLIITTETGGMKPLINGLQGEVIQIRGRIIIDSSSTARLMVYLREEN